MISFLSCGFADRGSKRLLDRRALVLTVADPWIWHGCGTNLSRRQSATTVGSLTDQARVCLAALPWASAKLPVSSAQSKLRWLAHDHGAQALNLRSMAFAVHLRKL